ncbi:MAG: trypsin-like peptidase domain-containing protein [Saprospiraceae bacterium]|nr:trypsin-like peptidase domain-containing protein [Saprospiraceae bacterium]
MKRDIMEGITKYIQNCTVKISSPNGGGGTGFFIATGLIVTCSHVVQDNKFEIIWQGKTYKGNKVVDIQREYPDICIISIDISDNPCVLIYSDCQIDDKLFSFGYPDNYRNGDEFTAIFEGYSSVDDMNSELIKFKNAQIRPGLSGSPLLNIRTGTVCGFVKSSRGREIDLGGRAICFNRLNNEISFIFNLNKSFHAKDYKYISLLSASQKKLVPYFDYSNSEKINPKLELLFRSLLTKEEELLSKFVTGSDKVKVGDLIKSEFNVLFAFEKNNIIKENNHDLSNHITEKIQKIKHDLDIKLRGLKFLILADPGFGKSTLSFKIFTDLLSQFTRINENIVPIHLDLKDFADDLAFGTEEWLNDFLKHLFDKDEVSCNLISQKQKILHINCFLILDSLDEYLSNCTNKEINDRLNKYIFKVANIVTCRTQYFERYISLSEFANQFEKYYISIWDKEYRLNYTKWYLNRFTDDSSESSAILDKIDENENVRELCKVPLRFNMTLELLASTQQNFELVDTLEHLYQNYIYAWLQREASRVGNILGLDDKMFCLDLVAWYFYDEGKVGDDFQKINFSFQELKKSFQDKNFLQNKYSVEEISYDVAFHSILQIQKFASNSVAPLTLKFTHKSFQEYFIARYIYNCIKEDYKLLADVFKQFVSQEVEQFFKDFVHQVNANWRKLNDVSENCIKAFELNKENEEIDNPTLKSRKRLAREQLAYNMGHLKSKSVSNYLINHLKYETDEFVRRSIILGLAFGGQDKFLLEYVDELRDFDNNRNQNEVNIGFQLTYFGDQPFDVFAPDKDQKLSRCSGTVSKLINQFKNSKNNRGSWRLDLFTILYLSKYRPCSIKNFEEAFIENLEDFKEIITEMFNDSSCNQWIELQECFELILKFDSSFTIQQF